MHLKRLEQRFLAAYIHFYQNTQRKRLTFESKKTVMNRNITKLFIPQFRTPSSESALDSAVRRGARRLPGIEFLCSASYSALPIKFSTTPLSLN